VNKKAFLVKERFPCQRKCLQRRQKGSEAGELLAAGGFSKEIGRLYLYNIRPCDGTP